MLENDNLWDSKLDYINSRCTLGLCFKILKHLTTSKSLHLPYSIMIETVLKTFCLISMSCKAHVTKVDKQINPVYPNIFRKRKS